MCRTFSSPQTAVFVPIKHIPYPLLTPGSFVTLGSYRADILTMGPGIHLLHSASSFLLEFSFFRQSNIPQASGCSFSVVGEWKLVAPPRGLSERCCCEASCFNLCGVPLSLICPRKLPGLSWVQLCVLRVTTTALRTVAPFIPDGSLTPPGKISKETFHGT